GGRERSDRWKGEGEALPPPRRWGCPSAVPPLHTNHMFGDAIVDIVTRPAVYFGRAGEEGFDGWSLELFTVSLCFLF
ncbi:MAG: hypothetical protein WCB96_06865, partial [Candidatus Aminicenantales bacterium]